MKQLAAMLTNKRTVFKLNAQTLFGMCAVLFLAIALVLEIYKANTGTDISLFANSQFIKWHYRYLFIFNTLIIKILVIICGLFAAIYYVYPRMFKRSMNKALMHIHFWGTIICCACYVWPLFYIVDSSVDSIGFSKSAEHLLVK